MNFTDDSLEKLRKKQAERKESVRKLAGIKVFFRRNTKRFLVAGLFAIVLSVLALVPGIGFTATVNITSSELLTRGHPCVETPVLPCDYAPPSCYCILGWQHEGIMNVTFNPHLYPVNHFFRSEVSTKFTRQCKPWVSEASFKQSLVTQTLLSEFAINILLFYAVGFILATVLEKVIRKWLRKQFR